MTMEEHSEKQTKVQIIPGGPVIIKGTVSFTDKEGNVTERSPRTSICRCGLSDNLPFCNGAHKESDFVG